MYSKEVIDTALDMYRAGCKLTKITTETGIPSTTVAYHARKHGILKGIKGPSDRTLKQYEQYCRGYTLTEVAQMFGISRQAVQQNMRNFKLPKPAGHVHQKETRERIEMHLSGSTPEQIAAHFKCSLNAVYHAVGRYHCGRAIVSSETI